MARQATLFNEMQRDPGNLDVILAYAQVAAQLGDNEGAIAALERLLLFNPNLTRANLELGVLYFRMGSFGMAHAYFDKAMAANPPDEVKARVEQYLAQIATEQARSRVTGYLLFGAQNQTDANVAPGSPLINSPVGPLLLSSEFVKKQDQNLFLAGSALYTHDLGTPNGDTFEVSGTGFLQHYFRVNRLDLDFGEVTAGPRFRFLDTGVPDIRSASLKPYAILNEVGLGENQYFYTYGSGIEGTATLWQDLFAKLNFEYRHKTFSNASDRPQSTGLNGDDKLLTLSVTKQVTANSAVTAGFDFLDQDTNFPFYSNQSYSASASYRVRYEDPTGWIGWPWDTTVFGSRLWSFYDAPDPCCNTSSNPATFSTSAQNTRHWRFGLTQLFQVASNLAVYLQVQRDIVSSNLPLYAYSSTSVIVGPQFSFSSVFDVADDKAASAPPAGAGQGSGPGRDPSDTSTEFRLEAGAGGAFGSNNGQGRLTTGSLTLQTNNTTLDASGLAARAAIWVDRPIAAWTGNPAFNNFSLGFEYLHLENSGTNDITATFPATRTFGGGSITGSVSNNFHSENLFLNAAWRLNSGDIHPYLGIGGGVALLDWSGRLTAPVLGLTGNIGILTAVPAGHAFVGVDYDITPNLYAGAGADFYVSGTASKHFTHTAVDLTAKQLSLLAHVGYRL